MKKLIIPISLILLLVLPVSSYAWVKLVMTAAEIAAPYIINQGAKYLVPASATANLPRRGYADASGVRRWTLAPVGNGLAIVAAGALVWDMLRGKYNESPATYPELKNVLNKPDTSNGQYPHYYNMDNYVRNTNSPVLDPPLVLGDLIKKDGEFRKVTSVQTETRPVENPFTGVNESSYSYPGLIEYFTGGPFKDASGNNCYTTRVKIYTSPELPPMVPTTNNEAAAEIMPYAGPDTVPQISDAAMPAIDRMLKNNPELFTFPTADVQKATAENATNTQLASLADNVASRQAAYDLNPTEENKILLNDAKAQEAAAVAQANNQAVDDSKTTAADEAKAAEDSYIPPSVDIPQVKSFSWQKLLELQGKLSTHYPFTLLADVPTYYSRLVADPVAPSFDLPIYQSIKLHVNLAIFDPIAMIARWIVSLICIAGLGIVSVRFWRGVS